MHTTRLSRTSTGSTSSRAAASRSSTPTAKAIKLETLDGDERTGHRHRAARWRERTPTARLNAGLEGSVVVNQVRSAKKGFGLNVDTEEVVDLVAAGIIDPTMVTRSALQNAASIAKNILTTEAIVAEAPERATAGAGHGRRNARHRRRGLLQVPRLA